MNLNQSEINRIFCDACFLTSISAFEASVETLHPLGVEIETIDALRKAFQAALNNGFASENFQELVRDLMGAQ